MVAVLTRPDAPAGRSRRLVRSPVARWADEWGVEVLTPQRPRDQSFLDRLAELAPDCVPVVAYGALVPPVALAMPSHGWVNLHFSLLPAWRGAAPVQHAVLHGDELTGASVFQLEAGLDTGPVFGTVVEPIRPRDTSGDLLDRLAVAGAELLVAVLDAIEAGTAHAVPQPADGVSLAPKITVADAEVRWSEPAFAVDRRIRACTPAPGAFTTFRGERTKLFPVRPLAPATDWRRARSRRGRSSWRRAGYWSAPPRSPVELGDVRPAGKRDMSAVDWARGARAGTQRATRMTPARPSRGPHSTHRREPARPAGRGGPRADKPVDPARRAAYEAIAAVHRDDAFANIVLPRLLRESRIVGRDAALATELTYGALRSEGQLDAIIAHAASRPVARIDPPARDSLRLGAYQLLYTRVPAHAAVATTVDLVRSVAPGAVGFANAVMRRRLRTGPHRMAREGRARRDRQTRSAISPWCTLIQSGWCGPSPRRWASTRHSRRGGRSWPRPWRRTTSGRSCTCAPDPAASTRRSWRRRSVDWSVRTRPYAVYLPEGAPGDIAAVARGRAHVQDEGSQLVAIGLADAAGRRAATSVGSTSAPVPAARRRCWVRSPPQRGARVTAVEIAPHRARLVEQAVLGLPVDVVCADGRDVGTDEALPEGGFDRVLVDAPCTGLGSLRRRPESRWRRQPSDLPPLTRLQRELLTAALRAVRPGGVVGYATCSPHLVETRVTVAETVRRATSTMDGGTVELLDARACLPSELRDLGDGPTVQLWPHRHGTDAMYLALLRRT